MRAGARRDVLVGLALLALAGTSFALGGLALGRWAVPVALAIAVAKASLIAVFFLRLPRRRASIRLAGTIALLLVGLLVGFAAADRITRDPPPRFFSPAMSSAGAVD